MKGPGSDRGGGSVPVRELSAGVVVVRETPSVCLYLLLRAYSYWDFPKGRVEEGETPLEGARREVYEETRIDDLELPWGQEYIETPPYARGKVARYYVGRTREADIVLPVSPDLGRPEHHEYRWLPYSRARRLLVDRVARVLDWAHEVSGCKGRAGEGP